MALPALLPNLSAADSDKIDEALPTSPSQPPSSSSDRDDDLVDNRSPQPSADADMVTDDAESGASRGEHHHHHPAEGELEPAQATSAASPPPPSRPPDDRAVTAPRTGDGPFVHPARPLESSDVEMGTSSGEAPRPASALKPTLARPVESCAQVGAAAAACPASRPSSHDPSHPFTLDSQDDFPPEGPLSSGLSSLRASSTTKVGLRHQ